MGEGPPTEWSGDTDEAKEMQHQKRVNVNEHGSRQQANSIV